ncbi:LicD family protein [Lachnospiraceae bacterium 62-35]
MRITMQFAPSFFEEEVRCDYKITEKQKKIWAVEIDLVNQILKICRKYDINVYAFSGTMLGAVRHKGFIPWDDDLDVCMLREDYNKFLKVAKRELRAPYFLQTPRSDTKFFCGYSRLRNSSTTGIIRWNSSPDYNNGIYVDIYVLDGFIENKWKYFFQLVQRGIIVRLINAYQFDSIKLNKKKHLLIRLINSLERRFIPYEKLLIIYETILTKYNNQTQRVSLMTHYRGFIEKYWCYKDDLENPVWLPFENIKIPVAGNFSHMLRNMYGNYMKFPPVEERGTWHDNSIIFDPDTPYKQYFIKYKT